MSSYLKWNVSKFNIDEVNVQRFNRNFFFLRCGFLWFHQIFQGCGNPKLSTKAANVEDKKRRGKYVIEDKSSGLSSEKFVSTEGLFDLILH